MVDSDLNNPTIVANVVPVGAGRDPPDRNGDPPDGIGGLPGTGDPRVAPTNDMDNKMNLVGHNPPIGRAGLEFVQFDQMMI